MLLHILYIIMTVGHSILLHLITIKPLSPLRISQIFHNLQKFRSKNCQKLSKEFLGGAGMLHQNIQTKISIIYAAKFRYILLQNFWKTEDIKKFLVEHTLFGKMCFYTRKLKPRTVFLTKVSKTTAAKQTERLLK